MKRREETRELDERVEKRDDRSIHHHREGIDHREARTGTEGESLSESDRQREDAPIPASEPTE